MNGSRNALRCAAVLTTVLLAGCQGGTDDAESGSGVPVSVRSLAATADEVGPDGADSCPLPYDFAEAVSEARITGEADPGPVPGDSGEPAVTAENGYEDDADGPFAGNPGALVSCSFHVDGRSAAVHLLATEKPHPEYLLTPLLVRVSGQGVDAIDPYLRRTEKGEPGQPVLGTTGDYATVRVDPEGEGHGALLLTLGDGDANRPGKDADRLDEKQLTALSRALYEQIS